ncbi:hypothetical protein RJ490_002122 [Pluralibacter gergoviae]|nr:hypothetical protein [Pluralibacter gergoviae]ELD4271295.1 hypothetical protein [Pluralibacter gergoviae]ELD4277050.1 hypothetical protein [Pluralibacter gergoviae]ELD4315874.1 hypothetical protein [Pluralibacter gergoviae]ELD4340590.1 hypothetical protein [Pluralibacter gergoviae]
MLTDPGKLWSVAEVRDTLGIADNTASANLRILVKEQIASEITANGQKTLYQLKISFD